MNNELMFSSKTDLWSTPQDLFDSLNKEFNFTLDPCADANNFKCSKYYTKEDDGLTKSWVNDRVFCNPPYGRKIGEWVKKGYYSKQLSSNYNCIVVMLLPARTDTKWFHEYILGKADIRFLKGRLKFGNQKNPAPFPSMIVIYK